MNTDTPRYTPALSSARKHTACLTAASLLLLAVGSADAAEFTWDSGGGDSNWSTNANWAGDPVADPVDNDDLVFAGTGETTNNDLADNTILSLDIQSAGFNLTGNVMDIRNNGTNDILYSAAASSGISTITLDLNANGGRDFRVDNAGNTLVIDGQITSTSIIDVRGNGTLRLINAANVYTSTRIRDGMHVEFSNGALGTGNVEFWTGTTGVIDYIGTGNETVSNQFFIRQDGTIRNSSSDGGALTLSNTNFNRTTGNVGGVRTATFDALNGDITVTGAIRDNDSNISDPATFALDVTKTGANILILTGVNEYTGTTTVSAGTLQIGGSGKLGGTGDTISVGAITIANGAVFQYSSSQGGTNARYNGAISGNGTLIKDSDDSELRFLGNTSVANIEINQGTIRGSGNVTSLGQVGTTINLGDTGGAADATLSYAGDTGTFTTKAGIIVRAGSSGTKTILNTGINTENTSITLNDDVIVQDSSTLTLGGVISGSGNLTKTNVGTTTLTGINSYSGDTTVSQGTLEIGGSGKVGEYSGAISIASGATFEYSSDQAASSSNRFVGDISGLGTFVVNSNGGSVTSRSNSVSVSTIEIKSGKFEAQADNDSMGTAPTTIYLGDTTGSANAELKFSGGARTFTTKAAIIVQSGSSGTKTISSSPGTFSDNTNITLNDTLTIANDGPLNLGGVISGNSGLVINSVQAFDTLTLNGANTYTGDTTVNTGTLLINGSTATGSDVTVNGGTIGGSGTIGGNITVNAGNHTAGTTGNATPTATQNLTNDVTYAGGSSSITWDLITNSDTTPGTEFDQFVVGGAIDFAGATSFILDFNGSGADGDVDWDNAFWDADQAWTVYSGATGLNNFGNLSLSNGTSVTDASGEAFSASIRAGGRSFALNDDGNNITLNYTTAIPEPGTYGIFGLGLALFGWTARRRRKQTTLSSEKE